MTLHQFFESLGSNEIKRRGVGEDKPLRMAKTLLHELCKRVVRLPVHHAVRARFCREVSANKQHHSFLIVLE